MAKSPTVSEFMTPGPQSIGMTRTIEEAHRLMRENRIRHLPVLEGGRLVGIVSERDLHLIETFRDVEASKVTVEEAMTSEPYVVGPNESLSKVALEMWKNKYGSAVVMDGQRLAGVFTTVDALGALAQIIARAGRGGSPRGSSAKKGAAKKAPARKATAKKGAAKKAPARKVAAKKGAAKKAPARKAAAKKGAAKRTRR